MDLGLSDDIEESFRMFQGRIIEEYEKMVDEFGLVVIDATRSIEEQQAEVRPHRFRGIDGHQENAGSKMARFSFFGEGLPDIDLPSSRAS